MLKRKKKALSVFEKMSAKDEKANQLIYTVMLIPLNRFQIWDKQNKPILVPCMMNLMAKCQQKI